MQDQTLEADKSQLTQKLKAIIGKVTASNNHYDETLANAITAIKNLFDLLPPGYLINYLLGYIQKREVKENQEINEALSNLMQFKPAQSLSDQNAAAAYLNVINHFMAQKLNSSTDNLAEVRYGLAKPRIIDFKLKPIAWRLLLLFGDSVQTANQGASIYQEEHVASFAIPSMFKDIISNCLEFIKNQRQHEEKIEINLLTNCEPSDQLIHLLKQIPSELWVRADLSPTIALGNRNYLGYLSSIITKLIQNHIKSDPKLREIQLQLEQYSQGDTPESDASKVVQLNTVTPASNARKSTDGSKISLLNFFTSKPTSKTPASSHNSPIQIVQPLNQSIHQLSEEHILLLLTDLLVEAYGTIAGICGVRASILNTLQIKLAIHEKPILGKVFINSTRSQTPRLQPGHVMQTLEPARLSQMQKNLTSPLFETQTPRGTQQQTTKIEYIEWDKDNENALLENIAQYRQFLNKIIAIMDKIYCYINILDELTEKKQDRLFWETLAEKKVEFCSGITSAKIILQLLHDQLLDRKGPSHTAFKVSAI